MSCPDPSADLSAHPCEKGLTVELMTIVFLGTPLWMWFTFIGLVIALLVLDLGILHKDTFFGVHSFAILFFAHHAK